MYAVVAFLDHETEKMINDVWKQLKLKQISNYGEESKNRRAHITIASYNAVPEQEMIDGLTQFYNCIPRVDLELTNLGTFLESRTLFISPAPTPDLIHLHQAYHHAFQKFDDGAGSLYKPGNWVPHCTIASRLEGESLTQAFSYCSEKLSPTKAIITGIALLKLRYREGRCVDAPAIWTSQ